MFGTGDVLDWVKCLASVRDSMLSFSAACWNLMMWLLKAGVSGQTNRGSSLGFTSYQLCVGLVS